MKYINNELNKLFCSFCKPEELEKLISELKNNYTISSNKIFILESEEIDENIITYSIDYHILNEEYTKKLFKNTIFLHRKKETNTLYTINALNTIIKSENKGILNKNHKINWDNYRNSILLTNSNKLRKLNTKIKGIILLE